MGNVDLLVPFFRAVSSGYKEFNTKGNPLCERYENTFYISSTSNDLLMNEISRSSVSLTDLNFDAWLKVQRVLFDDVHFRLFLEFLYYH